MKVIVLINNYEKEVSGVYGYDNLILIKRFCLGSNDYSYEVMDTDRDVKNLKSIVSQM